MTWMRRQLDRLMHFTLDWPGRPADSFDAKLVLFAVGAVILMAIAAHFGIITGE